MKMEYEAFFYMPQNNGICHAMISDFQFSVRSTILSCFEFFVPHNMNAVDVRRSMDESSIFFSCIASVKTGT